MIISQTSFSKKIRSIFTLWKIVTGWIKEYLKINKETKMSTIFHFKVMLKKSFKIYNICKIISNNNYIRSSPVIIISSTCSNKRIHPLLVLRTKITNKVIRTGIKTKLLDCGIELLIPCSRCLFKAIQGMAKFANLIWRMRVTNRRFHLDFFREIGTKKSILYIHMK